MSTCTAADANLLLSGQQKGSGAGLAHGILHQQACVRLPLIMPDIHNAHAYTDAHEKVSQRCYHSVKARSPPVFAAASEMSGTRPLLAAIRYLSRFVPERGHAQLVAHLSASLLESVRELPSIADKRAGVSCAV